MLVLWGWKSISGIENWFCYSRVAFFLPKSLELKSYALHFQKGITPVLLDLVLIRTWKECEQILLPPGFARFFYSLIHWADVEQLLCARLRNKTDLISMLLKQYSKHISCVSHQIGKVFKIFIICVVDGAGKGGTFILCGERYKLI